MPDEYASPEVRYRYNLLEWATYINALQPADIKAIAAVIYDLSAETLQKQVLDVITSGAKPGKNLQHNRFVQLLFARKDVETVKYLLYAKHCEPHVQSTWGYWEEPVRDTVKMNRLIEEGKSHYAACQSGYIRLRYAFQVVRLAHYLGNYADCVALYDRLVAPLANSTDKFVNQSTVLGWAMALKAGALLHLNQTAEAMYLFSVVFNQFADCRDVAIHNFSYGNEAVWQQMLEMGKTPDEKAAMWALRSLQNNALDIEVLEELYALAPASVLTEMILVREINKVERFILTPHLTDTITVEKTATKPDLTIQENNINEKGVWYKIKKFFIKLWKSIKKLFEKEKENKQETETSEIKNNKYIEILKQFAITGATQNKVHNTDLWYTAAGYMAYLQQNYNQCYKHLNNVSGADKKVQAQANLIYALARLDEQGNPDTELEGLFAEALKNLRRPTNEYDNYCIFSRVLTHLAQSYLNNNNVPRAFLCLDKGMESSAANALLDFYASETDLEQLQRLAENSRKTTFDTLLLNNSRCTVPFLADVLGTKLMRKLQYAKALQQFEKIAPDYWLKDSLHYFSYANYIYFTCNFDYGSPPDSCNKAAFARKVTALEQAATQNPQKADVYYRQLADGFFATPYWGYNGALWHGSLVATLSYYYDYMPGAYPLNLPGFASDLYKAQQDFLQEYGTRKVAIGYYEKVINATKDPELAANSAYMAALAQQEPLSTLHEGNYKDQSYQQLLKEKYSQTAFYRNIVQTCPGIGDF